MNTIEDSDKIYEISHLYQLLTPNLVEVVGGFGCSSRSCSQRRAAWSSQLEPLFVCWPPPSQLGEGDADSISPHIQPQLYRNRPCIVFSLLGFYDSLTAKYMLPVVVETMSLQTFVFDMAVNAQLAAWDNSNSFGLSFLPFMKWMTMELGCWIEILQTSSHFLIRV